MLEGDFSTGHPEGLSASSSILSYGLKIPADGNGGLFSTTVDVSKLDVLNKAQISKNC